MGLPGTVKFYNPVRGFGFVSPDGGGPEVFVHASVLERRGWAHLLSGQRVLVRAESTVRGLAATDIGPL
ncbi:MAG: cold shock domain-containing protein [Defluviicoccus sp.]|nr:cold shock domain-containing protein [Defluviicoccus sp.]MDE0277680.1 cold shock domain-containing protein [Defluviicoccus sp.]